MKNQSLREKLALQKHIWYNYPRGFALLKTSRWGYTAVWPQTSWMRLKHPMLFQSESLEVNRIYGAVSA